MQFEDISPAFLPGESQEPISSKDFQQLLYAWFEEKGLVADLRSYLRVQMINKLKNIKVTRLERPSVTFSLSKQAFNLIIGEHLLREGCHYTLSIFSTEIPPLGHQFPLGSLFEQKRQFVNGGEAVEPKWRFDHECVGNLLELIGISKKEEKAMKITEDYEHDRGSLLVCIVNNSKTITQENEAILNLPQVQEHIHNLVAEESRKTKSKYEQVLSDFRQELAFKTQQLETLKKETKKLREENRNVRKRIGELLLKEETNKIKETSLRSKMEELDGLQRSLQQKLAERQCSESCKDLQLKVKDLEESNGRYLSDIKRLEINVTSLTKDLEQGRNQVEFLRSCLDQSNQITSPRQPEGGADSDDVSSTDSNMTEEILNQVKERLKNLERESEELDKRFRHLKLS